MKHIVYISLIGILITTSLSYVDSQPSAQLLRCRNDASCFKNWIYWSESLCRLDYSKRPLIKFVMHYEQSRQ